VIIVTNRHVCCGEIDNVGHGTNSHSLSDINSSFIFFSCWPFHGCLSVVVIVVIVVIVDDVEDDAYVDYCIIRRLPTSGFCSIVIANSGVCSILSS
jgi:hypothetical protein